MLDIDHNPSLKTPISISNIDIFILVTGFEETCQELCDGNCKSLIKVINKPLLAYQLEFLERSNIRDVYIITNKTYSKSIDNYISSQFFGDKIKPELIITSKENVELFSIIKNKSTKSNFILMSGDTILNFDLNALIDSHIEEKALSTMILNDVSKFSNNQKLNFNTDEGFEIFGVCEKKKEDNLNKIVFYNKKENIKAKNASISKKLLKHEPNFSLLYNYEDIHFYIFNRNIFSIIDKFNDNMKSMTSIKDDFIPYLIKKMFSKRVNNALKENAKENSNLVDKVLIKCKLLTNVNPITETTDFVYRVSTYQRLLSTIDEIQKPYDEIHPIFFQTRNNTKNTFSNYSQKIQDNLDNNKQFNDGIPEIESMSADSYVAEPITNIGKGTRINRTIVGANLSLKEGCKITSCLLFDNVSIGKDCKISNSIIGENAIIGDNCKIVDCVVVGNYVVHEGTNANGKLLSNEAIKGDNMII